MKIGERAYKVLQEISFERLGGTDEELKAYLEKQCALIGSAMICTIHSFCLSVIKENYYAVGLSLKRINTIFTDWADVTIFKHFVSSFSN